MTMTVLDRALVTGDPGGVAGDRQRPDPEVPGRARRRRFTAQYKLDVLAAYDAAGQGEKGAILRREGLYSSHIVEWRRARDCGALAGLDGACARAIPGAANPHAPDRTINIRFDMNPPLPDQLATSVLRLSPSVQREIY